MKEKLKKLSKKWWFWVIIGFIVVCMFIPTDDKQTYTIEGQETGEYGKEVVLNANTDMPTTKYLYKLPAGEYTVTTNNDKMASFFIVKDEVVKTGSEKYPEELNYVSEQYSLTAGTDDFNGMAKKSVNIKLKADESIVVNDTSTYVFTGK